MNRICTMARLACPAKLLFLVVLLAALAGCAGAPERPSAQNDVANDLTEEESTLEERPATSRGRTGSGETMEEKRERAAAVIGNMSLREAVGQMFVVGMSGTEPDYYVEKMVRERNISGVLLFGYNMQSEAQTRSLTESLQDLSLATEPYIPLFIAVDHEGGEVSHAPWVTPQPAAADLGVHADPREVRGVAEQIGLELRRAGVNTDFAPVVDTGYGAAIGSRSFGQDPSLVSGMGTAAIKGFEEVGVVSAAKHFPNHGVAVTDSHTGLPVVNHDLQTIESYDLPPFRAAVEAGVSMVMVGHLVYPAIDPELPASLSPKAIELLREDLGFDGVVVTDDLAMVGATGGGSPAQAAVAAVKAGADLLVISSPPEQQADAYRAVLAATEAGEIPRESINRSVERIVRVKLNYPLYESAVR